MYFIYSRYLFTVGYLFFCVCIYLLSHLFCLFVLFCLCWILVVACRLLIAECGPLLVVACGLQSTWAQELQHVDSVVPRHVGY